jgi:hypothetical protein
VANGTDGRASAEVVDDAFHRNVAETGVPLLARENLIPSLFELFLNQVSALPRICAR